MKEPRRTVLVVDDDPDIVEVVSFLLGLHAVPVVVARDGVEALERLRESNDVGLVLLDLMMPRMSGADVLRAVRRDPALARTPIVVMSGNRDAAATATELGADDCLLKPVELDDLTRTVARYVPLREAVAASGLSSGDIMRT